MGKAAELILEKPGMKMMKSRVAFHVHGINYHYTSPLQGTLRPMLEGYQAGKGVVCCTRRNSSGRMDSLYCLFCRQVWKRVIRRVHVGIVSAHYFDWR